MKIIEKIKENYSSDVLFLALICFWIGVAFGLLASPAKNGITIGSYNGSNNSVKDNGSGNSVTDSNKTKKVVDSKIKDKL